MRAMIWVGILCIQAALFYGAVLGLALSLGSLHLQRVRREAAGAIELAQQQAQAAVRALITLAGAGIVAQVVMTGRIAFVDLRCCTLQAAKLTEQQSKADSAEGAQVNLQVLLTSLFICTTHGDQWY